MLIGKVSVRTLLLQMTGLLIWRGSLQESLKIGGKWSLLSHSATKSYAYWYYLFNITFKSAYFTTSFRVEQDLVVLSGILSGRVHDIVDFGDGFYYLILFWLFVVLYVIIFNLYLFE